MDDAQLFIAGATTRGAAVSARHAGRQVIAADLFCDRDLQGLAEAHRIKRYPEDVVRIASRLAPCEWMYTGGLENAPEVVDNVSQHHHLLGNPGSVLRRIRDPWQIQRMLHRAGFYSPDLRLEPPGASGWLRKPRASCGGMRIERWLSTPGELRAHRPGDYYQREVVGRAYGALYVASPTEVCFVGAVRQLRGRAWGAPGRFQHVGSIGPMPLGDEEVEQFKGIGECLTNGFGLVGLFGVDAILAGGRVWVLEVNPRYTASVEIHERARQWCALHAHRLACTGMELDTLPASRHGVWGKAIVYARQPVVIGRAFGDWVDGRNRRRLRPTFADLPLSGTTIQPGQPMLTVLVQTAGVARTARGLRALAQRALVQAVEQQD